MRKTFIILAVLAFGALIVQAASATHFRYGQVNWTNTSGNTVNVTIQNGWRRDADGCVSKTVAGPVAPVACTGAGGLPGVGDVIDETTGNTVWNWGDGNTVSSPYGELLYKVTSVDAAADWLFALAVDPTTLPYGSDTTLTHTYASSGTKTAFIQSCCRLTGPAGSPGVGGHINNPDGNYRHQTVMNVGATPPNTGPVSALPPIVDCPINAVCTFNVPAADANNDVITWRIATATEAAGPGNTFVQPGPPFATNPASINSATGVYTWNTTGASLCTGSGCTTY
jgi:hypothetical protein